MIRVVSSTTFLEGSSRLLLLRPFNLRVAKRVVSVFVHFNLLSWVEVKMRSAISRLLFQQLFGCGPQFWIWWLLVLRIFVVPLADFEHILVSLDEVLVIFLWKLDDLK